MRCVCKWSDEVFHSVSRQDTQGRLELLHCSWLAGISGLLVGMNGLFMGPKKGLFPVYCNLGRWERGNMGEGIWERGRGRG